MNEFKIKAIASAAAMFCWAACCPSVLAAPLGDCSLEPQLAGDESVVFCESWESPTWYETKGWSGSHTRSYKQLSPSDMRNVSLTSTGCASGSCLEMPLSKGSSVWLDISFQITHALDLPPSQGLEDVYFRYYLKLGQSFDPRICNESDWSEASDGGKLAGLSDTRGEGSSVGQCGNGGNPSDGLNCWSMRGKFGKCGEPYGVDECPDNDRAVARIGAYLYYPYQAQATGAQGFYDNVALSNGGTPVGSDSTCWKGSPSDTYPPGAKSDYCYCSQKNNLYCGVGTVGQPQPGNLEPNIWYAVEQRVRMNTPGSDDGVIQAWVNGELAYEKTDVRFRDAGHDSLHARTAWLNFFLGGAAGSSFGSCVDQKMWIDQMVISRGFIGTFDLVRPMPPTELGAN